MALQFWLPLTKDSHNQGLTAKTFTETNVSYSTNGKLGHTAVFDSTSALYADGVTMGNVWTVCCWAKADNSNTHMIFQMGKAASYANTQFLIHTVSTTNFNYIYYVINTTVSGNVTIPVKYTDWNHYALSYDGTTANLYVNGALVKSQTITTAKLAGTRLSIGSYYATSNKLSGMVQDFRVYDTCLDANQIKEISKGLVVHYTLSRPGNENLLKESSTLNSANWLFGSRGVKDGNDTDGFAIAKLTGSTADWGASVQLKYTDTAALIPYADIRNKTVTLSFWMKASKAVTYYPVCLSLRTASSSSRTKLGWFAQCAVTTSWHKFVRTVNVTDSFFSSGSGTISTTDYAYIQCYNHYDDTTVYVKGFKLEIGDKATPWVPNSADALYTKMKYDNGIEYDVSGFGNNMYLTQGALTFSSDTPKHNSCMVFNGATALSLKRQFNDIRNEVTIMIWAYSDNWANAGGSLFSCVQGGGYGIQNSGTGYYYNCMGTGTSAVSWTSNAGSYTKSSITAGWHHFAITYDGLVSKSYLDGVVQTTNTAYTTKTPIFFNSNGNYSCLFIGGESGTSLTEPADYFTGKLSDARIYATALSATDIKEIYEGRG